MTSQKFVIDLPSGKEFSIEEFVREVNKKYHTEYSVRAKETEQRDLVPAMIQQIHKRITGIEDYLNDWTESQVRTNKIVTDQCAILGQKVIEIDQWSNTVVEETNRVIHEINTHDIEGTRKYMFGVIDNVIKEINNHREVLNQILDFISSDALAERAIKNIEQLEATFQKELHPPQKRGRGRPRKTDAPKIKLSKKDIEKAKEEYEKLEAAQQPQKRGRGRPRKTEKR